VSLQASSEGAIGNDEHLGRRGGVRSFAAEPLLYQAAFSVGRVHHQCEPTRAGSGGSLGSLSQVASLAVYCVMRDEARQPQVQRDVQVGSTLSPTWLLCN
jgi:hypothetical protein